MTRMKGSLRIITLLTLSFILVQGVFFGMNFSLSGEMGILRLIDIQKVVFSRAMLLPEVHFIFSQALIYVFFIYAVWYMSLSISGLFNLTQQATRRMSVSLWVIVILLLLTANTYFVPHSFFTQVIRGQLFNDNVTESQLEFAFVSLLLVTGLCVLLTLIGMGLGFYRKQQRFHHGFILAILLFVAFIEVPVFFPMISKDSVASAAEPNIIIIGFDALRPDFLSYFNSSVQPTPNFDAFLTSSVVFNEAYTSSARTMPAWASILSSQYPKTSHIRENNMRLDAMDALQTLPKVLRQHGYATVYAADDRRFNIIDKSYGFDQLVGPKGTMADYALGSVSDFPFINLISITRLGKFLFPYSYANHGPSFSYDPNNFLTDIQAALVKRDTTKPLFLAVHFGVSAWPFYWFNDSAPYNESMVGAYKNSVQGDDATLSKFLVMLKQNKLLTHTIVVLLSDHGMTLGLPDDRVLNSKFYQGNADQMKVRHYRYNTELIRKHTLDEVNSEIQGDLKQIKLNAKKDYTVNTSYLYGSDVLSLKQFNVLLAFKGYGVTFGKPHQVDGRAVLMDVAPTLLQWANLPPLKQTDGLSLLPMIQDPHLALSNQRPIFFESNYSPMELEQNSVLEAQVVKASLVAFSLNLSSGEVTLIPKYVDLIRHNKQRAVLMGDWLFAHYPKTARYRIVTSNSKNDFSWDSHDLPAYTVLVNLKTHQWTDDVKNIFYTNSSQPQLSKTLTKFYGDEMAIYQ